MSEKNIKKKELFDDNTKKEIIDKLSNEELSLDDFKEILELMEKNIDKKKIFIYRFISKIKELSFYLLVHLITNFLLMALFVNYLTLDNKYMVFPIIGILTILFTLGDYICSIFKINTNLKRFIIVFSYITIIILIGINLNSYFSIFKFESIWFFYVSIELFLVLFIAFVIDRIYRRIRGINYE